MRDYSQERGERKVLTSTEKEHRSADEIPYPLHRPGRRGKKDVRKKAAIEKVDVGERGRGDGMIPGRIDVAEVETDPLLEM